MDGMGIKPPLMRLRPGMYMLVGELLSCDNRGVLIMGGYLIFIHGGPYLIVVSYIHSVFISMLIVVHV